MIQGSHCGRDQRKEVGCSGQRIITYSEPMYCMAAHVPAIKAPGLPR